MILVNGKHLLNGTIDMPLYGVWNAVFTIDHENSVDFPYGSDVTIADNNENGLTFKGIVVPGKGGSLVETVHVRISGKKGLDKKSTPKQFKNAFVKDIINSLMNDSGKSLSSSVSQSLLNQSVSEYSIVKDSVANCLGSFLQFIDPNINWRVKADGTIWFGLDTFPEQNLDFELLLDGTLPSDKKFQFGIDTLSFEPGITIKDIGNIANIQYQILPDTLHARVMVNDQQPVSRDFISTLQRIIANEVRDQLRYSQLHAGKVVSQSADWSHIDVSAVNSDVPSVSNIPIITGSYENIKGGFCLFGWDGADPSRPFGIPFPHGDSGAQYVALSNKVNDNLNAIQTAFNAHTHKGVTTGSSSSLGPDGYSYTATNTAATKVKAV